MRYCLLALISYSLRRAAAQNGTFNFFNSTATSSSGIATTPLRETDDQEDSPIAIPSSFPKPTRTKIGQETITTGPTSWISTSYDWSLDVDRLFPTYLPEERANFQAQWDCDQRIFAFTSTYIKPTVPLGNITSISYKTFEPFTTEIPVTSFFNRITYSHCDGVPRYGYKGGVPSYTVSTSTSTIRGLSTGTWTLREDVTTPPVPYPCTVDDILPEGYCSAFLTVYTDYTAMSASAYSAGTDYTNTPFEIPSSCRLGLRRLRRTCVVRVSEATMLYWPPTARSGDFCQSTTTPPTTDGPATGSNSSAQVVTLNGTEYTSPWVYITYHSITYKSKWISTYGILGTKIPSLVLSFLPNEVSSICEFDRGVVQTKPFDFNDLQGDVPWSAYNCSLQCTEPSECLPMDQRLNPYNPYLAWPQTFLDLLHSWNTYDPDTCSFGFDDSGIPDPPQLLTTALHISKPAGGPAGSTTVIGPVTASGLKPTLILPKPVSKTTVTGPSPSLPAPTKPAEPVKQPSIGDIIISMINQPPDRPQDPSPTDVSPQGNPIQIPAVSDRPNGNQSDPEIPDSTPPATSPLPAPEAATITLGPSLLPIIHLPNNAHVLDGFTFWAGDAVTTAGTTISFARDGVVVNGVSTASYTPAPFVTVFPASDSGFNTDPGRDSDPSSDPGGEGIRVQGGPIAGGDRVLPAALMVGGEWVVFGSEIEVAGKKARYDAEGLMVGGEKIGVPVQGWSRVVLEGGEVWIVGVATAGDSAKGGNEEEKNIGEQGGKKAGIQGEGEQQDPSEGMVVVASASTGRGSAGLSTALVPSLSTDGRAVETAVEEISAADFTRAGLGSAYLLIPILASMVRSW
ncbi:hypothetical protein KVT40_002942 [Elsinoe batatas]|uniref:Uncharacterized protein n=1 Tax=Elsinoe batatas TaxID=2601811 RepID=A0A8K0L4L6_9PEZI|nr:hypothetical protein KVT40_002942 [Elsinoe batatas]